MCAALAPLLLSNLYFIQREKLVGFHIVAVNKPGALAKISSVLGKYNVNIVAIVFSSRIKLGEKASIFIITDFTYSKMKPKEIEDKLKELDVAQHVNLVKPQLPKILVDPHHFPVVDDLNRRFILLSESAMKSVVVRLRETFGTGGLAFLYHQGKIVGSELAETYKEMGISDLKDAIKMFLLHLLALGRYLGEITYYKEDRIIIRLHRNWECEVAMKHNVKGPASYFERGVIAGFLEKFTGKKVSVHEIKCLAKGDPYCEFLVTFLSHR